ncbi:hypothetical protein [Flavobacterium sp.]|uniref:hypothetical protein n=1 Tax=Flavobacterium sp. TaxID=239 RepID=UPI002B6630D2|nr:hypothetical protein [Flavobacterium sp.]HSD08303.1 hypothetical protein [Flavobacterium sp.]
MKYLFGIALLLCFSCGNKEEVLLPKADRTIVKEVADLSPIYIFFGVNGKDTLADVNRKNSISTTNWILNIDKRLPLRLVIPEVIKLQEKKREASVHKNETAQNYYSYADSIGKNLAFLPFTKVYYKIEKPTSGVIVYFAKDNSVLVNNILVKKTDLAAYLKNLSNDKPNKFLISFDKNSSYGNYIQNKIFIESLEGINFDKDQEFIF